MDADCRAVFDCVIPEIIRLALIAKGVPENMVRFMYSHLTQTNSRSAQEVLHLTNGMEEAIEVSAAARVVEHRVLTGY